MHTKEHTRIICGWAAVRVCRHRAQDADSLGTSPPPKDPPRPVQCPPPCLLGRGAQRSEVQAQLRLADACWPHKLSDAASGQAVAKCTVQRLRVGRSAAHSNWDTSVSGGRADP